MHVGVQRLNYSVIYAFPILPITLCQEPDRFQNSLLWPVRWNCKNI